MAPTSDPFPGGQGHGAVFGRSKWVIVGNPEGDPHSVATSVDGGNCWTRQVGPVGVDILERVAWSQDLAQFVAVGDGSSVLGTSPDAVTWTTQTTPMDGIVATGAVWASAIALWVVSGQASGGESIMTSDDGITWTARATPADGTPEGGARSVCWSPDLGLLVASCGEQMVSSTDGITWSLITSPNDGGQTQAADIAWSSALGLFVSVWSPPVPDTILTSPDGVTWTPSTALPGSPSAAGEGVCWSPDLGLFVMVGQHLETSLDGNIAYSSDGVNWTVVSPIVGGTMSDVAWTSVLGGFVAVGTGDQISLSADGIIWALATCALPPVAGLVFSNDVRAA